MNKVTILALLFLITIVHASRVYYVSNFGSNDNNGLSETTAFKSINHANKIAKHGDIIKLSVGHYQGEANCISFHSKNITLVGPAKLQCNKGLRIKGVNFHGVNITVNNVTISHADNITLENVKLSKGLFAYDVNLVNLTSVYLTQGVVINTVGSDLHAVGVSSIGSGVISVRKGGVMCVECNLPLFYLNTTKPTSVILTNSTFVGVSVYKLQTEKNTLNLRNFGTCNITGTNITCEDSGYTGIAFISSNCTVTNSTIENCTTTYNTSGVAIHVDSSNSTFTNVTIQNNSGNSTVYVGSGSNITITNSTVGNNWGNETTNGTAFFVANGAELQLNNTIIHNNVGYNGAAIFISENARVKIENSLISNNRGYLSGDIACEKKPESLIISDSKLIDNSSVRKVRSNCFD